MADTRDDDYEFRDSELEGRNVTNNYYSQSKHSNGNGANRIVWAVCGTLVVVNVGALIGALAWFNMRVLDLSSQVAALAASFAAMQATLAALIQRLP